MAQNPLESQRPRHFMDVGSMPRQRYYSRLFVYFGSPNLEAGNDRGLAPKRLDRSGGKKQNRPWPHLGARAFFLPPPSAPIKFPYSHTRDFS
jgi:hypothetical protein